MKRQSILGALTTLSALTAVWLIALGSASATAQTTTAGKTDEQALRELIKQENEGKDVIKQTEESIFVSGMLPRPVVGRKETEAAEPKMREDVAKRMPNQSTKTEMKRLVVARSGDLAYDSGDFTISFDAQNKTRKGFDGSYLRVWRKKNGEWLVDAFFARPNEPEEKPKQK